VRTWGARCLLLSGWILLWVASGACSALDEPAEEAQAWKLLEPGLALGVFRSPQDAEVGDSLVRVLRIDPDRFELKLLNASAAKDPTLLTARQWSAREGLMAAINASMYQKDYRTSVSLMQTRNHTNNPTLSRDQTILVFDPLEPDIPEVRLIDRECDDFDAWARRYGTKVQSIRMISCKGQNVWSQQPRRWSTAAIGMDQKGRVLFIHVRSPFSTHDLIEILKALPLDLSGAMYVEGGPQAQLYIRTEDEEHEFLGAFEAGLRPDSQSQQAWPLPNVVGVVRRPTR
jgi:uncharacterized protein YigE (DUF2233 family)